MNLTKYSDQELISSTQRLVQKEREILTEILWHLKEIDRRRLYSDYSCKSLFEYAVKYLNYSEDQAYRRIQAARLLKDLPEIEEKINTGELSLAHLSLAQSHFRVEQKTNNESLTKTEKLAIITQLEHTSVREAERVLATLSSVEKPARADHIRTVTDAQVEIKFFSDRVLLEKIAKLKGLLAHKYPQMTMADLFDKLCDFGFEKWDPAYEKPRSVSRPPVKSTNEGQELTSKNSLPNKNSLRGTNQLPSTNPQSGANPLPGTKTHH